MTVPQLHAPTTTTLCLEDNPSWWDPDSGCTIVIARPKTEPTLWEDYVRGAEHSYRRHGVESALDVDALRRGDDTLLFCAGVNQAGRVVGGLRAKGPYRSAEECHAIREWAGQPGESAVRKMVTDRIPFGVIEMKTAWVNSELDESGALTDTMARSSFHSMALLDINFIVATAASYVLNRWLSSGGVMAKIPATPYPDHRYQTKMMWWDRQTIAKNADPKQLSKFLAELERIKPRRPLTTVPDLALEMA